MDPKVNSFSEEQKQEEGKPHTGSNAQTLPPPDSKTNTPANPQGFQGAPIDQRPHTRDRRSQKSRSVVSKPLPRLAGD